MTHDDHPVPVVGEDSAYLAVAGSLGWLIVLSVPGMITILTLFDWKRDHSLFSIPFLMILVTLLR